MAAHHERPLHGLAFTLARLNRALDLAGFNCRVHRGRGARRLSLLESHC